MISIYFENTGPTRPICYLPALHPNHSTNHSTMEIQPDAIISSESYDSHSTDENRAVWAEAVNEFVQEGRLTRRECEANSPPAT